MRYTLLGLLVITWVFWNVALFRCTFVAWGHESEDWKDHQRRGIFSAPLYEDDGRDNIYTCVVYHPGHINEMDAAQDASRFFGALGYTVHMIATLIVLLVEICVHQRAKLLWAVTRVLMLISMMCSVLIFVAFASEVCRNDWDDDDVERRFEDYNCSPGPAGIIAIFNIILILLATILSWIFQAPDHPLYHVRCWASNTESGEDDGGSSKPEKALQTATLLLPDRPAGEAPSDVDSMYVCHSEMPDEKQVQRHEELKATAVNESSKNSPQGSLSPHAMQQPAYNIPGTQSLLASDEAEA